MIHHNIYNSWSWTEGHANNEENLLELSIKEAKEETGLKSINPILDSVYSIEILTVDGHMKNNQYISSHLHLNITYLLEADKENSLYIKSDENSGVHDLLL